MSSSTSPSPSSKPALPKGHNDLKDIPSHNDHDGEGFHDSFSNCHFPSSPGGYLTNQAVLDPVGGLEYCSSSPPPSSEMEYPTPDLHLTRPQTPLTMFVPRFQPSMNNYMSQTAGDYTTTHNFAMNPVTDRAFPLMPDGSYPPNPWWHREAHDTSHRQSHYQPYHGAIPLMHATHRPISPPFTMSPPSDSISPGLVSPTSALSDFDSELSPDSMGSFPLLSLDASFSPDAGQDASTIHPLGLALGLDTSLATDTPFAPASDEPRSGKALKSTTTRAKKGTRSKKGQARDDQDMTGDSTYEASPKPKRARKPKDTPEGKADRVVKEKGRRRAASDAFDILRGVLSNPGKRFIPKTEALHLAVGQIAQQKHEILSLKKRLDDANQEILRKDRQHELMLENAFGKRQADHHSSPPKASLI